MNEAARQELCQVVAFYGKPAEEHVERYVSLLHDFCGRYPGELAALCGALQHRTVFDLAANHRTVPWPVLQARLVHNLQDTLALDEGAAQWAVESWALALRVITPHDACPLPPPPALHQPQPFVRVSQHPGVQLKIPDAEARLRQAVQLAISDGKITNNEMDQLRGLRRLLNLPRYTASRIYHEVKAERSQRIRRQRLEKRLGPLYSVYDGFRELLRGTLKGLVDSALWLAPRFGRTVLIVSIAVLALLPVWFFNYARPDYTRSYRPQRIDTPRIAPYTPPPNMPRPIPPPYIPPPPPVYMPPPPTYNPPVNRPPVYTPPPIYTPPPYSPPPMPRR